MAHLYQQLAHLWPLLSPVEDYIGEAERIRELIECHHHGDETQPLKVVELGAGGGHTLFHLVNDFKCTAVDLSDAMLENSRHINPDVNHVVADMRQFELPEMQDVVLLHDAAEYLLSETDIAATFGSAARCLKPGGLLIVATSYLADSFESGEWSSDQNADEDTEVCFVTRVEATQGEPNRISMNLTFFIRDLTAEAITIETDRHACGLFDSATWQRLLADAGFIIEKMAGFDEDGDVYDNDDEEPIPTFVARRK